MVQFNTGLVRNLGHINVFLGLWAQLFKETLGTHRLAIKLERTQTPLLPKYAPGCFKVEKTRRFTFERAFRSKNLTDLTAFQVNSSELSKR